jgi:hypothetical protein
MKDESRIKSAVIGIFADSDAILHAAESARQKGWKRLDAITPYPVHGMEHALGVNLSWVPWVTVISGVLGGLGGFALEAWVSSVQWPHNIGGKPFISWPAFVPVMFECAILSAGICTFVAMWMACGLPKSKPHITDERLTDDKFGLVVPLDEGVTEKDVCDFLKGAGADEVRRVDI